MIRAAVYLNAGIYLYSGNILKIAEDIKEVKPSLFISVPRL